MPGWVIALIAGGTSVVVLLVLAAVAIPTFLDQRARAQTPHIPDRVGHLTRSHDPSVTAELDSVTPTMSEGFADVETGVFLTSDGSPFLLVVTGRDRTGDGEDDFERATREFMAGLANSLPPGNDVGPAVDVAAGPVGGRVACAEVFSAGQPLGHSCLSARGAAIVITFSLGPTDEALVTMVRRAVLPEQ